MEEFAVIRNGKICFALVSAKVDLDSRDFSEVLRAAHSNCPDGISLQQDLAGPAVAARLVSDYIFGNLEPQYVLYFVNFAIIFFGAKIADDKLSISSANLLIRNVGPERGWTVVSDMFDPELKMSEQGLSSIRSVFSRWDECFEETWSSQGEVSLSNRKSRQGSTQRPPRRSGFRSSELSIRKSRQGSTQPCLATLNIGDPIDTVRGGGLMDIESEDLKFITKFWFSPFVIDDGRILCQEAPVFTVD